MPRILGRPFARLPSLVVFDVDYTLWPMWCDTHSRPPYRAAPDERVNMGRRALTPAACQAVIDGSGAELRLYPEVPEVLGALSACGVPYALASRTDRPEWLEQIASLLTVPAGAVAGEGHTALWRAAAHREMYPQSKLVHFLALAKASGVGCENMLFFDDEARNSEVETLGVTFKLVDEDVGVTKALFLEGLEEFEAAAAATEWRST